MKYKNSVAKDYPDLIKYFKNEEEAYKLTRGSGVVIDVVCPICGFEKKMRVVELCKQGFYCNVCDDGISFPNKILRNLLKDESIKNQIEELNIEWNPKWEEKVLFDAMIIINNKKICIEMQGEQHETGVWNHIKDINIKKRDNYKRKKCKEENIIEIEIDCKKSDFDYIKSKILESNLINYIKFDNVNWNEVHKNSLKSAKVLACELYDNSSKTTNQIAKELNLHRKTITRYLKEGAKVGICTYSKEDNWYRQLLYRGKYFYIIYKDGKKMFEHIDRGAIIDFLNKNFPGNNFYEEIMAERAKSEKEVNGLKITRREKTQKDVDKIYNNTNNNLYNPQV